MNAKTLGKVTEESIIFLSILKWILLAVIIGVLVGGMASFFLIVLDKAISITDQRLWLYGALPLVMGATIYITTQFSPDSEGHGTEKVIRAVHRNKSNIRFRVVPVKLVTTILTIACGGSVGKEGPCAQIGAALASGFSRLFRFSAEDRKKLVICGISAGFSSVFGTPIAGAIFGVEVLFVGNLLYSVLLPSFISGMVSYQVTSACGIHYSYHLLPSLDVFNPQLFVMTILGGVFFGLICVLFVETLHYSERLSRSIKCWPPLKGIVAGICVLVLAWIFSSDYLGLGLDVIENGLTGHTIVWYAFLLKIVMTCITLSFGGSGGLLTPLFFVGVTAGTFFATLFDLDVATFAAFGMVSLLAGAANTPLAACILAVELFGASIAPFATISCVISFFMTGYRSIFPSQVLSASKADSVFSNKGEDLESFHTRLNYPTRRMIVSSRHFAKKMMRRR